MKKIAAPLQPRKFPSIVSASRSPPLAIPGHCSAIMSAPSSPNNANMAADESKYHQDVTPRNELRGAPNADAPGSYSPVVRLETQIVDPGETVTGAMFFTGYGTIGGAKMVFYPATQIFDVDGCTIEFRTLQLREGSNTSEFAIHKFVGNDQGITILFPQWQQLDGSIADYFFQIPSNGPPTLQLTTEGITQTEPDQALSPPITFRLKTSKDARPGTYPLTFVFTYFNGASWLTVTLASTFTVRNILQRHETRFGIAAVVAAVTTIVAALLTAIDTWDKTVSFASSLWHYFLPPL
ncbi:hypothetical protein PQQ53_21360 [Paraburkholderia strydomiana]|uniref:hypothetical protein n=1 Tax=Paraburkholderia strydomiana TaxID=1245417 RepID=UPI0038BC8817